MQEETPLKRFVSNFGLAQKIVLVVVVLAGAAGAGLMIHNAKSSPSPKPATSSNYVSKTDGFSIKFRTTPKIDHATVPNASGGNIPQTTYETASKDGKAAFAVAVVQYPASYVFSRATLQEVAKSQAKSSIDGKLLTESYVSYLGRAMLESSYRTNTDGTTYTVYGISLANNHKLYTAYSIGASKADFSSFAKTFAFVKN